ncbi:MAG: lysozyme [Lachnospiraceae bacterium]|nr:lysozyme [Lachnospiraceae bacterium]
MLKINLDKMEKIDISVDSYVTEVKNLANRMKHVYAVIEKDSYGMNTEKVKKKIEHWYKVMEKEAKAIENMGTGLERATVKYHNMENDVVAYFTGLHAEKVTMKNNAVDQKAAEKKTEDKYKRDKINDSLYKNSSTAQTKAYTGKTTQEVIKFIKEKEGFRSHAYKDGSSYAVGYGHNGVSAGTVWTKEQADKQFLEDIKVYERYVDQYMSKYHWNANQYSALVSFTYNLGPGGLKNLTANGTRTNKQIADKMLEYCHANGKWNQGLYNRRMAERNIFLK